MEVAGSRHSESDGGTPKTEILGVGVLWKPVVGASGSLLSPFLSWMNMYRETQVPILRGC